MLTVVQGATIAVALGFGTIGVSTIVTGRVVFPWLRRGVGRPVVWGVGTLVMAAALAGAPWTGWSQLAGCAFRGASPRP
ncbi:hypothetical protein GCM10010425_59910 [Streptomyces spororaveus]|uniref:Uncharacterized protein n=1 Tax=Streptomyces spororaveus TaxID=284039 RepID=A0ABQ3T6X2_9ACTN|nr:hypothetical protein Sspor_16990 [Streptomyces spororaveus]